MKRRKIENIRNIGISAHVDAGKTTATERFLFYSGVIHRLGEVHEGNTSMDFRPDEIDRGITIQSAATHCAWRDCEINLIDTPGHVDFTIEVERALRILDGAIMVFCGVAGVQSQSHTVDRQMRRYGVPRIAFINKMDLDGANAMKVLGDIRDELGLDAALIQLPIFVDEKFTGIVDVIRRRALYFEGKHGETVREAEIPDELVGAAKQARGSLISRLAEKDDEIAALYVDGEEISAEQLRGAIRRLVIRLELVPVLVGSAYKKMGMQPLLDAVCDYLPSPGEARVTALDLDEGEAPVALRTDDESASLVALVYKTEEGQFGRISFIRVYQGTVRKGDSLLNTSTGKKLRAGRIVRVNARDMKEIELAGAGDVVAMAGLDADSGDTLTDGTVRWAMTSMHVPEPVISLAVEPRDSRARGRFAKAAARFTREDPTFRVRTDPESGQTLLFGMGELQLDVYLRRMRDEFECDLTVGRPAVSYRETITRRADFEHLHKKQGGGPGQYAKLMGYIEPIAAVDEESPNGESGTAADFEFVNRTVGGVVPKELALAAEKGFRDAMTAGALMGAPVRGVRVVITDGETHVKDSNEFAFRACAREAFDLAYADAAPIILEPIMSVSAEGPDEHQAAIFALLNQRRGRITGTAGEGARCKVNADVPLEEMFGFVTPLRSSTKGQAEFTMEFRDYEPVPERIRERLVKA